MSYGLRDMDGARVELCDECGFDAREQRHLPTAFVEVYSSLEQLAHHADSSRRPEADTWSGTEYVEHCVDVTREILAICNRSAGRPQSATLESVVEAAAASTELANSLADSQWDVVTDGWPFELSVRGAMVHLLHDLEHHALDIRRGYAKLALAQGVEIVTRR